MRQSPRYRRLCSDQKAMLQLDAESLILSYTVADAPGGVPPEVYLVTFRGYGLYRHDSAPEVLVREHHQVMIRLSAAYPRMMPELMWKTPIFHPNISSNGIVCLGGYSTHWVPSLRLDQLCEMLWDMIRYENYDVESPYNREAAQWARVQDQYRFPVDPRSLREITRSPARADRAVNPFAVPPPPPGPGAPEARPRLAGRPFRTQQPDILFMDEADDVVQAELVPGAARAGQAPDILYIE